MTYRPPLDTMLFAMKAVGLDGLVAGGAFPDLSEELVQAVLAEAGKLAEEVWAPLNRVGDLEGAQLANGVVTLPKGFADAYRSYAEGGWAGLAAGPAFGGQGLPSLLDTACAELWTSANMALSLCPMLSRGAISALAAHGSAEQQRLVLPKLVSGAWTGTMNLTEPQAGSDVGALKTKAEPVGDGTYRITGTKIFITWGEHEAAENIIHLVLARLPGAPEGTRGISLFLVPKYLVKPDGTLGARNDLRCIGLEEKLGIHASPTCVMSFGENGGAIGSLIGAEHRGMAAMFTMMNDARLNVGVQGLGIAEAATQRALAYARERRQGRLAGQSAAQSVPIVEHPDVRRMLTTMRAQTEAARAICYATALAMDLSHAAPDEAARGAARARADLLTPVAKGWSTDIGVEVASLGLQVHGGMGFIEETGAAQYYRDARIAPIYEGTNGIQAIDLVTRKLPLDDGRVLAAFLAEMRETAACLSASTAHADTGAALSRGITALAGAGDWLRARLRAAPDDALAGATPYLALFGIVAGGYFLGKGALMGGPARGALARFHAHNILPQADGLAAAVTAGNAALDPAALAL
jgi:alkylation response protein AidB-like acyl-CoA dehydrogenase